MTDNEALVARVEELGVELAQLRRALLSLGSQLVAGGPPGGAGYKAWHEEQLNPPVSGEPAPA